MDILIESLNDHLWAAAVQNGKLQGLEIDPDDETIRWGAIYQGRVSTLEPSMNAAFVELGQGAMGLIHAKDVHDGRTKSIAKALQPGQLIAVQAKTGILGNSPTHDVPMEMKFPRLSTNITLPGRHLILAPRMKGNRISKRIRDKDVRDNMQSMMDSLGAIKGCILRASSVDIQTDVLIREGEILKEEWQALQKGLKSKKVGLLRSGLNAVERILSDHAGHAIRRIEVTTMDHLQLAEEWCLKLAPDLVTKISPIALDNAEEDLSLFDYRDLIEQIEELMQPYIVLPGKGSLIIDTTAAATIIDVNSGADKRKPFAINVEAAQELGRQLRIRNLGGIIIVDFLKGLSKTEQTKLAEALIQALDHDPCTVEFHGFTNLGLAELSRQRRTPSLGDRFPV